ncbi:MAG: hypothetical protein ACTSUE_09190, partial [Promethearchaeota archaeon]
MEQIRSRVREAFTLIYPFLIIAGFIIPFSFYPHSLDSFHQPRSPSIEVTLRPSDAPVIAEFYVSPAGNDSYPGNVTQPFLTIARAQQAVQAVSGAMNGSIAVYLRNGTYPVGDGLQFTADDGGKNGHRIIYKAFPGETPVIDGGVEATGWVVHDGNIWKCFPGIPDTRQLYVMTRNGSEHNTNDPAGGTLNSTPYAGTPTSLSVMTRVYNNSTWYERRAIRAREAVPGETFSITGDGHGIKAKTGTFANMRDWTTPSGAKCSALPHYFKDVEFVYHLAWTLPRVHVETVTTFHDDDNFVLMQQPAFSYARTKGGTQLADWGGVYQPDWVENAYELLDEPGEWYFDKWTGWLYYYPLSGEDLTNASTTKVIVPRVQEFLSIEGNDTAPVENLKFEGITFKHSTWLRPNQYGVGHVDLQANYVV